ncbi:unnamed protein product, partial [Soboliphyme baturini]|uniref:ThiF domain-containing protein n=1 Tax=Soboliphyme baturini TaxID=241478 RepID=A0A183J3Z4_9BILA
IYDPDENLNRSLVVPCTVGTTCGTICTQLGLAVDDLHIQFGGDLLRRLTADSQPLKIQNSFLASIGFDAPRQQDLGDSVDLRWLIRFYAGK